METTTYVGEIIVNYKKSKSKKVMPKLDAINSQGVVNWVKSFLFPDIGYRERFIVLFYDTAHNPIGFTTMSLGIDKASLVCPKMVAQHCLLCNASNVVLFHNHPSGNLLPSEQDRKITKAIKNALELFSVSVNDHIILSADGHYSFLDMGVL